MDPVTPSTLTSTTTAMPSTQLPTTTPYAEFISSAAANILSNGNTPMLSDQTPQHFEHNQITFEIPTHRDLQHIDALHSFNTLLKRIGNVAYDTLANAAATTVSAHNEHDHQSLARDAAGQTITPEQISHSAVLNLADLKNGGAVGGFVDRFFAGADIHSIINYLWIGVVTSLIILSIIFIVFSCYFWRKFREWKKCNKDIRAQLNGGAALHNGNNGEMLYPGGQRMAGVCDSLIGNVSGQTTTEAAFYQIESPPCYTIATGLPTYDEALHHHQQHYAFGMKYIYPNIMALRHQQYHEQQAMLVGNESLKQPQTQKQQSQSKALAGYEAPPAYDMTASVALLEAGSINNNNSSSSSDYEQSMKSDVGRPIAAAAATAQSIPQLAIISSTPSPQRQFEEKLFEVVVA